MTRQIKIEATSYHLSAADNEPIEIEVLNEGPGCFLRIAETAPYSKTSGDLFIEIEDLRAIVKLFENDERFSTEVKE